MLVSIIKSIKYSRYIIEYCNSILEVSIKYWGMITNITGDNILLILFPWMFIFMVKTYLVETLKPERTKISRHYWLGHLYSYSFKADHLSSFQVFNKKGGEGFPAMCFTPLPVSNPSTHHPVVSYQKWGFLFVQVKCMHCPWAKIVPLSLPAPIDSWMQKCWGPSFSNKLCDVDIFSIPDAIRGIIQDTGWQNKL